MTIVFVSYINTPEFDQPEQWIDRIGGYTGILEALSERYTVISIEQIRYQGIFRQNGVQYHFLDFGKKELTFPRQLHRYVKNCNPDIVVVHGILFPLQVLQLRVQLGRSARIIVQNHAEKPATGAKKWLQKMADRCIDAYLFTAREMGEEWVRQGIIRKRTKIREVMEASSSFRPADKIQARNVTGVTGHPVFLWVGRLDYNKDPLTVVRAFLKFTRSFPNARLYMLYHERELLSELEELLRSDGADRGSVVLVGRKPHEEMIHWYNASDYILSGSHYEGSGVAVCEAMSCGCIPVVTDILSFRKMTADGDCGALYEPGNEIALQIALFKTLFKNQENERRKTLRQFQSELSFEAIARHIHRIVESLSDDKAVSIVE
ncbi:MAG: glycosyltransferase family 4 protein [Puia sp.]|nr:glycosyltransferase family 4 protein [Puia sp.]